ncbi:hypothetical protein BJ973_005049 [Actinoplanes tereljensis]|uniref:DUF1275 domain-containing protein n=1 Tax=Paractinoplanes tereljensis TaxID=571912 RepID=A0A919NP58_9ACTN|nr:DUF1275 family protein [Actinoplanes tereljensis]GIF21506.1 hypothetical protein Ate02nite_42360 [Actinoplanes tereljensis]
MSVTSGRAMALAATAGSVDLLALTVLGGAFASIVTGNLVTIGFALGAGVRSGRRCGSWGPWWRGRRPVRPCSRPCAGPPPWYQWYFWVRLFWWDCGAGVPQMRMTGGGKRRHGPPKADGRSARTATPAEDQLSNPDYSPSRAKTWRRVNRH